MSGRLRTYQVYLGSAEQFRYTFYAKNARELKLKLGETWDHLVGRWYRQDASGCPKGSKRFIVKGVSQGFKHRTPVLIVFRGRKNV